MHTPRRKLASGLVSRQIERRADDPLLSHSPLTSSFRPSQALRISIPLQFLMSQPPAKTAGSSRRAKFDGSLPDAPAALNAPNGGAGPRRDKGKQRADSRPTPSRAVAIKPPPGLATPKTGGDDHAGNTAEDGICFICADDVTYWAVGECGHRTCHVCSIRLRALFKKTDCTFCKVSRLGLARARGPRGGRAS